MTEDEWIEEAIARSSLGSSGAQRLRARVPERARAEMRRVLREEQRGTDSAPEAGDGDPSDRDLEQRGRWAVTKGSRLFSIQRQGPYLIASIHTALDDSQLLRFQDDLIEQMGHLRARGVVIDVNALDVLDNFASRTLRDVAVMARLRGARTVVVGIQPEVAFAIAQLRGIRPASNAPDLEEALAQLDIDTSLLSTAPDLEEALAQLDRHLAQT